MFKLRYYQQDAVDAVIAHVKKRLSPCLLELATGAGKSLIVAELAKFFSGVAPSKKVLCIAPSKELVEQNAEKYEMTGYHASIYCASAGKKCLRSQVIFASPQSALKSIDKIARMGISAIIIDEAHGITPSLLKIIDGVLNYEITGRKANEKCRIVGMTATPYRMNTGYIYSIDATQEEEIHHDETKAVEPFFSKLLYRITAGELVEEGFLTKPEIGDSEDNYDTSGLELNRMGKFDDKQVAEVFQKSTKTEKIVNEITQRSQDKMGVMIFASTISHAEEIAGLLPQGESEVVTGKLKKKERADIINRFKAQQFKYIVNVDVLTTGFDAPHVDLVGVMRATESASLFQQIIGRGLRLHENKPFVTILDYAENIERHELQEDIFTPQIKAKPKPGEGVEIEVTCPACGAHSVKKKRSEMTYAGLAHDAFGNFLISGTEKAIAWEDGEPVLWEGETLTMQVLDPTTMDEFGDCGFKEIPVPAHYSRRCSNPEAYVLSGKPIRCDHRYSAKVCPDPDCHADNDIAARHCVECKVRLVDPNEKLTEKAGQAGIIAMGETRTVHCLSAKYEPYVGGGGKHSIKATYNTEIGAIVAWHTSRQHWIFNRLAEANGIVRSKIDDAIDAKYSQCAFWTVAPHQIKVKKSEGQNGYAKFEVKQVEFLEEQVG
ncbi:coil containing protein [Vibrio phage 1.158.O._10N.261.45.E12]|nr:P-loop containing nucleoside triphosphate hydrolase [Vibrio phage 1.100.O._10N.261.45.C3]AUR91288.1 coil containing protein [Vibrio phage 1.158.O._10N.261.45.E12]AUR92691.1 coil containing protein [Vibrio phage 1.175.O._10N.261.55.B3]